MRMTIVCEDRHVDEVRQKSQSLIRSKNNMRIPLSPTGNLPATHWMCVLYVDEEGRDKLESLKKHSIIAKASPKFLLSDMGLKIISDK
jgi:hypothetical protein